jgi:hypothetical protein
VALFTDVQTQAVIASAASPTTGLVSEISKDKSSAATGGVRVFLHGIELCEFGPTSSVDHGPLDRERGDWLARVREPHPSAKTLPHEELARLERGQDRNRRGRAAESWWKAVQ